MNAILKINQKEYAVDFSKPIDISIPLKSGKGNVSAWYVDPVKIEAVQTEQFTGSVKLGGSVNFRDITFNPHGNGTHTECVGHISVEEYSVNQCLKTFFFLAQLHTIEPKTISNGDAVITYEQINTIEIHKGVEAFILRTKPNPPEKKIMQYSNSNPPYIEAKAMKHLVDKGVKHFLIDLPSVDREFDDGVLASHHVFWNYPEKPALDRTITELIYVPNSVDDGLYLLNIQMASFENDASPSKPVIYAIEK